MALRHLAPESVAAVTGDDYRVETSVVRFRSVAGCHVPVHSHGVDQTTPSLIYGRYQTGANAKGGQSAAEPATRELFLSA